MSDFEKRMTDPRYVWNQLNYDHDVLIEASAGTGKTYALESIVLKLVTERGYAAKDILLVTFAEKAAGELKNRIRSALDGAHALKPDFDEMMICTIHSFCRRLLREYAFENGMPMRGDDGGDDAALLDLAVTEAIKSPEFSAQHQPGFFDEMLAGDMKRIADLTDKASRILKKNAGMQFAERYREDILNTLKDVRKNARALLVGPDGNVGTTIVNNAQFWTGVPLFYTWMAEHLEKFSTLPVDNPEKGNIYETVKSIMVGFPDLSNFNPDVTIRKWNGESVMNGKSGGKLFNSVSKYSDSISAFVASLKKIVNLGKESLPSALAEVAAPIYEKRKGDAATMTFDDMVLLAANAVCAEDEREKKSGKPSAFFKSIRERYRVALVDEFQDTDQKQWDIFRTLFSHRYNQLDDETMKPGFLLVVGDPKQAIYSFRGADVKVYCAARDIITENQATDGNGQYKWQKTLSETFRSKASLINAFNVCFGGGWFENAAGGDGITYSPVKYPEDGNDKFDGMIDEREPAPVVLLESMPEWVEASGDSFGNKSLCLRAFMERAAAEMKYLNSLSPAYRLPDKDTEEQYRDCRFSYGKMCVLVDTHDDATVVRRILAKHGIPYGEYKQQGLYASPEAEGVRALFDYLARPSGRGNLAALLMSPLFDVHPARMEAKSKADDGGFGKLLECLSQHIAKREWNLFAERVMTDPATALSRPDSDICRFNRRRAAVRQIFDRLLREHGRTAATAEEMAAALRAWRKNDKTAGENGSLYEKESSADRVQIMTMHASKGLQFPIVFLAYGFSNLIKPQTPECEKQLALEERHRLLYVALTRAEHRLYLPWSERAWGWKVSNKKKNEIKTGSGIGSVGSALLNNGFLGQAIQTYFDTEEKKASAFAPDRDAGKLQPTSETLAETPPVSDAVHILEIPGLKSHRVQWDSFSAIYKGGNVPPIRLENGSMADPDPEEPLDLSVKTPTLLPRGRTSGDAFHEIMEALCKGDESNGELGFCNACDDDLGENSRLLDLVGRKMKKFGLSDKPAKNTNEEVSDSTKLTLARMVTNALKTEVVIGNMRFKLKDIARPNRLAEVEFVCDENKLLVGLDAARDGMLNGKIDLLVRIDDKVFVLDWKTNSLRDYELNTLKADMTAAGYHLQYELYSLAVSEWLKQSGSVLAGVAYLFVRGGETGDASGVYPCELNEDVLNAYRTSISKMGWFAGNGKTEEKK